MFEPRGRPQYPPGFCIAKQRRPPFFSLLPTRAMLRAPEFYRPRGDIGGLVRQAGGYHWYLPRSEPSIHSEMR